MHVLGGLVRLLSQGFTLASPPADSQCEATRLLADRESLRTQQPRRTLVARVRDPRAHLRSQHEFACPCAFLLPGSLPSETATSFVRSVRRAGAAGNRGRYLRPRLAVQMSTGVDRNGDTHPRLELAKFIGTPESSPKPHDIRPSNRDIMELTV